MTRSKLGRSILCTWEMGGDLGHISRLSSITHALEKQGDHVVLAVKDLSRTYPFFKQSRAKLIQAPNWLLKMKMQRPIACIADALLLLGYVDSEALFMLAKAWQAIVDLVKPDLVIFDCSPTALLALRDCPIPKIIVGTGFSEPVPGYPIADWRHPQVEDNLIAEQERVALHPINLVLKQLNKTPLSQLSELWQVDSVIINWFKPFDLYHKVRTNAVYCLHQAQIENHLRVVYPDTGRKKILTYIKSSYPNFEPLIQALANCDADVFVASPMAPEHKLKTLKSEKFNYSTALVNITEALTHADLFLSHGGGTSVKESLIAETPILVLPTQQEQLLTGTKLQELGVGILAPNYQSISELTAIINNAIKDEALPTKIKGITKSFEGKNKTIDAITVECCNRLLATP